MKKIEFLKNKIVDSVNKAVFSSIFKKINYSVSVEEFVSAVNERDLKKLVRLDFRKIDNNLSVELFNAYYFLSKKDFSKSLMSSFSVIEFLLRKEYSKTAINSRDIKISELLKWAKNRNIISSKNYNYLEGIRQARNKAVHNLKQCLPEESYLALSIATEIISFYTKK